MVDIFDEVDEELRAERAQQLLKRYGWLIVAGALAIVGAAAGWQGWRWYEARQDQAAAVEYLTAMNLADATAAGSSEATRTAGIAAFAQLAATGPRAMRPCWAARGGAEGGCGRPAGRRGPVGPCGG